MKKKIWIVLLACLVSGCSVKTEDRQIPMETRIQSVSEMWHYAKSYYGNWQLIGTTLIMKPWKRCVPARQIQNIDP